MLNVEGASLCVCIGKCGCVCCGVRATTLPPLSPWKAKLPVSRLIILASIKPYVAAIGEHEVMSNGDIVAN